MFLADSMPERVATLEAVAGFLQKQLDTLSGLVVWAFTGMVSSLIALVVLAAGTVLWYLLRKS